MNKRHVEPKQTRIQRDGSLRTRRNGFPQLFPVRLEYHDEKASEVCISGSFNNWNPAHTKMAHFGPGEWLRVLFLPPGRHEYLFVVDGHCVTDPRSAENVPNVYGCLNSVMHVGQNSRLHACDRRIKRQKAPRRQRASEWRERRFCRMPRSSRLESKTDDVCDSVPPQAGRPEFRSEIFRPTLKKAQT